MLDFYTACIQVAVQMDTCSNKQDAIATTLAICYQQELTGVMPILGSGVSLKNAARFVRLVMTHMRNDVTRICGGHGAIDPFDGLTDEQLAKVLTTWEALPDHPTHAAIRKALATIVAADTDENCTTH